MKTANCENILGGGEEREKLTTTYYRSFAQP